MANVHGLGDIGNQPPRQGYQNLDRAINQQIPFMNPLQGDGRTPMQQTIPYTLKILCCPDLKVISSHSIFLLAIWIIYIICLTRGISQKNQEVLEVLPTVLQDFGAAEGTLIRQGEIFRLITASFLHANLLHILMNSISLLILLTRFEKIFPFQSPFIMLAASITGFMLSVLCNRDDMTVGASTAIFGILGAFISYLIINWTALEKYGPVRSTLTCIIGIIVVFSFLFSIGSSIDVIAHLGGLLGGLFVALAILPGLQPKNRQITWVGASLLAGMNLLTFCLFFFTG